MRIYEKDFLFLYLSLENLFTADDNYYRYLKYLYIVRKKNKTMEQAVSIENTYS
jgi:SET domain-containing protein